MSASSDAHSSTHGSVFFDGTCAFCVGAVVFIARRDPKGYFRFGASETPVGRSALADHGIDPADVRSLVLIEADHVYLRSTAALRIARRLVWPWSAFRVFLLVPAPLRDPFYRFVALVRHRVAGRSNTCELPPKEIGSRLL